MRRAHWIFRTLIFLGALCFASASAASGNGAPLLRKTSFGLLLHDRGPASDRNESGLDLNWELQFRRPEWEIWRWLGSPFTMIGATPNFNGGTSVLYGGISYELILSDRLTEALSYDFTKELFLSGGLSAALHNGPLHKNKVGCRENSDCGFGYRVLPRLSLELGAYFWSKHGVSLFYDHMSHKGVLPGENEGIDHIGIRYHFVFPRRVP
jgi:hypothetical protein